MPLQARDHGSPCNQITPRQLNAFYVIKQAPRSHYNEHRAEPLRLGCHDLIVWRAATATCWL